MARGKLWLLAIHNIEINVRMSKDSLATSQVDWNQPLSEV